MKFWLIVELHPGTGRPTGDRTVVQAETVPSADPYSQTVCGPCETRGGAEHLFHDLIDSSSTWVHWR